jgi:hypothetical protein
MAMIPSMKIKTNPKAVRVLMWNVTSSMADFLFNVSNVVLMISALAILLGTIGSIKMGAVREQFSNERISANEAETARAKAEATKAQLALEQFKAPRSLTDEQISHIRERMRSFAGQHFGMITYWDVKEPSDFTKRIGKDALIAAGWVFVKDEKFVAFIGIVTGVEVALSEESDATAKRAAIELVSALAAEGIIATIRYEPTYKDIIKIQIGMKP